MTNRAEAIAVSRRLLRGFAGAPDPRRHAQQLFSVLVHADGWSGREQDLIAELGIWLQGHPQLNQIRGKCEATLEALAKV